MSGPHKTTSSEDINSESSEMNIKLEMSSGDDFVPEIRLSEAPLFIHDTEIEIKYEDVDYNNTSTPALDCEADYDLDFEIISKTRAELSSTAIHIQNEVDEGIVKMECSEEEDSGSEPGFKLSGSDPDYCPSSSCSHLTQTIRHKVSLNNDALHDSISWEAGKIIHRYKCSECGKSLATKSHLTVHMRTHTGERPYTCEECAMSFLTKNALTRHKMIHTGEKPYTCGHCQKSFTRLGDLTSHTRTHMHTRERPYQCDECEQSFTCNSNLIVHKRIHTGERPYECSMCERSFAKSSDLTRHRRIHTGERPYKCDECGKSFTLKSTLSTHIRTHSREKQFKCDRCYKSFTRVDRLVKHRRLHSLERNVQL